MTWWDIADEEQKMTDKNAQCCCSALLQYILSTNMNLYIRRCISLLIADAYMFQPVEYQKYWGLSVNHEMPVMHGWNIAYGNRRDFIPANWSLS